MLSRSQISTRNVNFSSYGDDGSFVNILLECVLKMGSFSQVGQVLVAKLHHSIDFSIQFF